MLGRLRGVKRSLNGALRPLHTPPPLARAAAVWHSTKPSNKRSRAREPAMDLKTLIILVLLVGVGVLGYLYYDARQHSVSVELPNLKIEAK